METDAELLRRFVASGDQAAFRSLVERHAGMVHGVALRAVGDAAMAEEITQAVLIVFARKARGLARKNLAGWLHDAAVLEARNFSRKAARYRKALVSYQSAMSPHEDSAAWESVSPHLDEAMSRLPEREKNLVIMRYHERRSFREIAAAFGKSEDASRKEVDKSVQRLGDLLRKRGVFTTGAALSSLLAVQTLCVPPASAASLAAAALRSVPLTGAPLLERLLTRWRDSGSTGKALVLSLLALSPAVYLQAKNTRLEEQIRELKRASALERPYIAPAAAATAAPPSAASPPAPAVAFTPDHSPAKAATEAREKAGQEISRLSLNLPTLTDQQKADLRAVLERRAAEKATAKMRAFESGALARYAEDPESISEEDRSILLAMEPVRILPAADTEVRAILTPDQFGEYLRTEEARRVSDAENTASDVLKGVGSALDLDPALKDGLFQSLARLELDGPPPLTEAQLARPFAENDAREQARDRIILERLTPEQAAVYARHRAESKARFNGFLKSFGPKEKAK